MGLTYNKMLDFIDGLMNKMEIVTGIPWKFNSRTTSGAYEHANHRVVIGAKELLLGRDSNDVSFVNYVSMHKQCFHEYRHWQQYNEFFQGKVEDSMSCQVVEQMAVQSMISNAFPNYSNAYVVPDNYFNMIMELDAEEYALINVKVYLLDAGLLSENDLEFCMKEEINRRMNWWGDRPVALIDDATLDLHRQKVECKHLSLQDVPVVGTFAYAPIYQRFCQNPENMRMYSMMSDVEQDKFLVDFICRHDVEVSMQYPVIQHMFPNLPSMDKVKRYVFRKTHGLKDDNVYDGYNLRNHRRLSEVDYGDVGDDYHDVPDIQSDVSNSRPLPSVSEHMSDDGDYGNSGLDV